MCGVFAVHLDRGYIGTGLAPGDRPLAAVSLVRPTVSSLRDIYLWLLFISKFNPQSIQTNRVFGDFGTKIELFFIYLSWDTNGGGDSFF